MVQSTTTMLKQAGFGRGTMLRLIITRGFSVIHRLEIHTTTQPGPVLVQKCSPERKTPGGVFFRGTFARA